jgi:hypothetical protein
MSRPVHSARLRRAIQTLAVAACVTGAAGHPAAAQAHRSKLQPLAPISKSAALFPAPDRVRARPLHTAAAARTRARASTAILRTADGVPIAVEVSSAYTPNPAVEQSYVNLLGSLVHGPELANLSVYIATPGEIRRTFCGPGALACYVGKEERMYVPGMNQHSHPPVQFLIAHEYGHHIEMNRSDAPWHAFDQGPRNWASYENVCALERRHRVGTTYFDDPSEAFAESYADMQYPGVDFIYTGLLAPDQGAFRAIRADVLNPWQGPHTVTLRGSGTRTFQLATPLDGSASFDLSASEGASYRLRVLSATRAVRRARHSGGSPRAASTGASYLICGARSLTLRVANVAGSGPFTLNAAIP